MSILRKIQFTWGLAGFAYLVVASLATHLLAMPPIIRAFLALPALVLIPLQFGELVATAGEKVVRNISLSLDPLSKGLMLWLLGALALTLVACSLQLLGALSVIRNLYLLVIGSIGLRAIWLTFSSQQHYLQFSGWKDVRNYLCSHAWPLLAICLTVTPLFLFKRPTPFPFIQDEWTVPTYISQMSTRIIDDGYVMMYNPTHRPALFLLTAIACRSFNIDPVSLYWVAPFLLYPVFSLGLFYFGATLSGNKAFALLVALFGLFIMIGPRAFQGIPARLRTNAVLYSMYPLTLRLVHRNMGERRYSAKNTLLLVLGLMAVVGLLFCIHNVDRILRVSEIRRTQAFILANVVVLFGAILIRNTLLATSKLKDVFLLLVLLVLGFFQFHLFEGVLFLSAVLGYAAAICAIRDRRGTRLAYLLVVLGSGWILLQYTRIIEVPAGNLLSSLVIPGAGKSDFWSKYRLIEASHSDLTLLVFLVGFASILLSRKSVQLAVAVILVGMFSIFFLPDVFSWRIHKEIVPFMSYGLAYAICSVYRTVNRVVPGNHYGWALLVSGSFVVFMLPGLIRPFYEFFYLWRPSGQEWRTCLTDYEYEVVDWLREHLPPNARIVSDYQTTHVVGQLVNTISIVEKHMRPVEMTETGRATMWHIKQNIFQAPDSASAWDANYQLRGSEPWREKDYATLTHKSLTDVSFVVIISGKTSEWIEQEDIDPLYWPQHNEVDQRHLNNFLDTRYFSLLTRIGDRVYVFLAEKPDPQSSHALLLEKEGRTSEAVEAWWKYLDSRPAETSISLAERHLARLTGFDFLSHLNQAEIETPAPKYVKKAFYNISGDLREVLFEHSPSEVTYVVRIPTLAILRFGIALDPRVWDPKKRDGVTFDIFVEDGSGRHPVFSKYIDPKNTPGDRKWFDEEVDLGEFGGQMVKISFVTSPGPAGDTHYDWAAWSRPVLLASKLAEAGDEAYRLATFGGQFELVDGGVPNGGEALRPEDTLQLALYWKALEDITTDYKVFAHLYDVHGNLVAQQDSEPCMWNCPTSRWRVGETVYDLHSILLPEELKPGQYVLGVGLYNQTSGQRVVAYDNQGHRLSHDMIILGKVQVEK